VSLSLWVIGIGILFDKGEIVKPEVYTERDGLQASSVHLRKDEIKVSQWLKSFYKVLQAALHPPLTSTRVISLYRIKTNPMETNTSMV